MTIATADPIVFVAQPESPFDFGQLLRVAKAIAHLSICDQGTALAILFEALEDEGVDVQAIVPCVLAEMTE